MKQTSYTISDAAKTLNVEAHVLRYWEEELELSIHRNDLGHRCYSDKDIILFRHIKTLKEEGFSLHDIKSSLPQISKCKKLDSETIKSLKEKSGQISVVSSRNMPAKTTANSVANTEDKLTQFREIMNSIISQAMSENNNRLASMICENTSERVMKEMNYLFRTLDEDETTRIKQLEAAIEAATGVSLEAAAAKEKTGRKKHFLRRKNNQ